MTTIELKNIQLFKGECAICRGLIDKEWSQNPQLGIVCQECTNKRNSNSAFGPENVEIVVEKELLFDPVLGVHEYHFKWRGTRIMINGKVGVISESHGCGAYAQFEGDEPDAFGTYIKGVGYFDLLRIYKTQGGETQPPPLEFGAYVPTKAELLSEPILPVQIKMHEGNINSIQVGHKSIIGGMMFAATELPNLSTLHAFTNLYVRYKFGLSPNFCAEGGFHGNDFEVRNAGMFIGGVGLSVRMNRLANNLKSVSTVEEFRNIVVLESLLGLSAEREQSRPGVVKDGGAQEVLSTWVAVMETLLRYDWSKVAYQTNLDIWIHFCRMQDVLLNIMSLEELSEALTYASKNRMVHCGSSY